MNPFEIEGVRQEVDALASALEEERFRHVAGLEPAPSLSRFFLSHSRAAHKDTVAALREQGDRDLADRVAALRAERGAAADEEEWRAAEARASAPGPDGPVSLAEAERAASRERDRSRRLAYGLAAAAAAAAVAPARERALETRARLRAESGLAPDREEVAEADRVVAISDDGYRDVLAWFSRRSLGLLPGPGGELERADLLHLLAAAAYQGLFPAGMLAPALSQVCRDLGLDLGRIRVDDADRPGQWPGAHAVGARVSLRRRDGASDWLDLFRAAGEALGAASAPGLRRRGAAGGLGALLEGLFLDAGFLGRRLGVERKHAADLTRLLALQRLFALRARAAALRVASEFERGTTGAAWREAHREALSSAALAAWPEGLAARDGDAGAHAAALAEAARGEALRRDLVERFDVDFWRNPRTAEALAAAAAAGPDEARPSPAAAAVWLVDRLGGKAV